MINWKTIFEYNNGLLYWNIKKQGVRYGTLVGTPDTQGYLKVRYQYKWYRVHRIVYELFNGSIDKDLEIDHINGVKTDNRIENLRLATRRENSRNRAKSKKNTSGIVGVWKCSKTNKWRAGIKIQGKQINLGSFKNKDEAIEARSTAEKQNYGQFSYSTSQLMGFCKNSCQVFLYN